ncbi:protein containing Cellulosome anchoring protein, cohesin region, partial [Candidatus Magnetomorum sp. HK-1]
TELKDDIADATTSAGTFTLIAVDGMSLEAGDVSGDPEDEVIIPINISDISAAFDSDAFGFTLKYDSNVLSFVSVEKTGTLVEPFTMVNGSENTPGEVKVSGAYFGGKATINNGLFVNIKVKVKADATVNTSLELDDLKDDIANATTADGTFTLTGEPSDIEISSLDQTNGPETGDTLVTITGSNFVVGTAATVKFGANDATEVNVVSVTQITCKSPAGTGTVDVTVSQNDLTSNAVQFTYDPVSIDMKLKAGEVSGESETEVIIPINISNVAAAFESDAFGFTLQYDSNVLSFVSVDKMGTLVEPFTMVNGSENTPGEVKVSGAFFGGKATINNGVLVNIKVLVKADATEDTSLILKDLKDDIADAETENSTFELISDEVPMVYPDNVEDEVGSSIAIPILITNVVNAFESDAFGFTLKFDSNILSFVSVDKMGTQVENFTMVNGSENEPGEVKISGAYFGGKATINNGLLVHVNMQGKISGQTALKLIDFKDDIEIVATKDGLCKITGDVQYHSADYNPQDNRINLSELLRVIQIYNFTGTYYCKEGSEDGYMPGYGEDKDCGFHSSDYAHTFDTPRVAGPIQKDPDWTIDHSELQRMIQLYNMGCYQYDASTEDHFKPVECD